MLELDPKYLTKLNDIKVSIQHSEQLKAYLDEEEDELYTPLKDAFEPLIEEVYNDIAANNPLQLILVEKELLHPDYEGLFMPRILGYSVMRGQINESVKYIKPQEHFKSILKTLCNSANFDVLQLRSGKTIEIGFALSSDIWITNLLNELTNKKVRQYLEGLKLPKYRDEKIRLTSYRRYKKQFSNFNYLTASAPQSCPDLTLNEAGLNEFLIYRSKSEFDNSNLKTFIGELIDKGFENCIPYLKLLMTIGLYFDLEDSENFATEWSKARSIKNGESLVFDIFNSLQEDDHDLSSTAISRLYSAIGSEKGTEFDKFLELMVAIEDDGYINESAVEKIRAYYNSHEGLSLQNESTRTYIFNKFKAFISRLETSDFQEYFEFNPVFITYMKIFANEKFNQDLKAVLLKYVRTLLRTYTDKRSKDYQDIKKFVQPSFMDMGFMNEKSVKELFKTKRKPREAKS